jgi:hypothetical protein
MKRVGYFFLGLLLALATLSIATPFGLVLTLFSYGTILTMLFFKGADTGDFLLIGYTIGLEFFGTHHFGSAALASVVWYGLSLLFNYQLRFTSPYIRFIVAVCIGLVATTLLLYPLADFIRHILIFVALVVSIFGAFVHHASEPAAYELL